MQDTCQLGGDDRPFTFSSICNSILRPEPISNETGSFVFACWAIRMDIGNYPFGARSYSSGTIMPRVLGTQALGHACYVYPSSAVRTVRRRYWRPYQWVHRFVGERRESQRRCLSDWLRRKQYPITCTGL